MLNIKTWIILLIKFLKFFKNSYPQLNDKFQKLGRIIKYSVPTDMYLEILKNNINPHWPFLKNESDLNFFNSIINDISSLYNSDFLSLMMEVDKNIYLKGDILHKVDRAGMYYGLETRIPFLNSKIINFSSNISVDLKIKDHQTKYIVKELAKKYLPNETIKRKKWVLVFFR